MSQQQPKQQHAFIYRGRVRSGCLTCRSRKVKCDEKRPICANCARLERSCVYKPRKDQTNHANSSASLQKHTRDESVSMSASGRLLEIRASESFNSSSGSELMSQSQLQLQNVQHDWFLTDTHRLFERWKDTSNPLLYSDISVPDITVRLKNTIQRHNERTEITAGDETVLESASHATLISRDIELTTTMDILATREVPPEPSFVFFLEEVDCPWVTPYDATNWQRMKSIIVTIGKSNAIVTSAIMAISILYKAQLFGLPSSKAILLYDSAKHAYKQALSDNTQHFQAILVATFLLCLFEYINYEMIPCLKELADVFIGRLQDWKQHESLRTELSMRIIVWLQLLDASTIRGGGMGIVSESIYEAFANCEIGFSSLKHPLSQPPDASNYLYEVLSAPIFGFYFQLQSISGEIARETHYHRSRTTAMDQEAVVRNLTHIKSRLKILWEDRSAPQQQKPEDLRSCLAPNIANPIITLIGLCTAAYHAELVEIERVLGDPVSRSDDSIHAMRQIRETIDGDWNAYGDNHDRKLNQGYLRPLFLYAIECMDLDENQWAVDRMSQIRNPICRSDFFAKFGKALSDVQLRKKRRVATRYFCFWFSGVLPPFM